MGREAELEALRALVRDPKTPFISLVGVGGVGKSRLAAELAARDLGAWGGRVAFVALDGVSDPSLVLPAIAGALGVTDEAGRPLHAALVQALTDELGTAPSLLVLDTVEHLRAAAPALADLVERTPGLTILATTRLALRVPRERVVWVEPLPVPAEGELDTATIRANPAAALFLERALVTRPELETTPANVALIGSICRRLDGIPLAIELAAAALRVLAPHQLLDQLAERVTDTGVELTAEASVPDRQRSLRAAMDWSLGLLPEPVLRLHRRVAVIAGAFSPATAERLLERGERRGLAPIEIDVADGLRQLADASLLRSQDATGEYEMLSTVRADALDRLAGAGEAVAMRWAHAYEVLSVVEEAERLFPTEHETEALDRLDGAHNDIREALEWAMQAGDGTFALRLAGALAEFWRTRGHHTEGRLRLAAALTIGDGAPRRVRRKALGGAGLLASYQGDYALGEAYLREALALAEADGDDESRALILNWLGTNSYGGGRLDDAEAFISESVAIRRRLGDAPGIATALNALGGVYHFRGHLDEARVTFQESLALKQHLGNPNGIAISLTNLGLVERDAGRPDSATKAFEEAIAIWERTGDRQRVAVGVHNAALVAIDLGRYDEAAAMLSRAWELAREVGDRTEMAYAQADRVRVEVERGNLAAAAAALADSLPRVASAGIRVIVPLLLEGAGGLAAARGEDTCAVRLWSAATAERTASGFVNMPADERLLDAKVAVVRDRLEPAEFAAAWAEGAALTPAGAVDEAMALARRATV
ncbi:MAG TPA: tetratricopeptide repeat protein [Candidatus Limnocylindrales bacterium]|nr:tetratricopeptide repeat protein [Candidatus Limnocylindrales bacterium]